MTRFPQQEKIGEYAKLHSVFEKIVYSDLWTTAATFRRLKIPPMSWRGYLDVGTDDLQKDRREKIGPFHRERELREHVRNIWSKGRIRIPA